MTYCKIVSNGKPPRDRVGEFIGKVWAANPEAGPMTREHASRALKAADLKLMRELNNQLVLTRLP